MNAEERGRVERVFERIPRDAWDSFLESEDGARLKTRIEAVRGIFPRRGARPRPTAEILDLLGHRIFSEEQTGAWLREQILRSLPSRKWERLRDIYREVAGSRAASLHGNMVQQRAGSRVMGEYWHQGSYWAREFCTIVGLPDVLALERRRTLPDDEEIEPVLALPPLHDFQVEVYRALRRHLSNGTGTAAMLSLPTGAGKTRVTVEAICDYLTQRNGRRRNLVLWIAQSHELQEQAWECFRQVWQVPPQRSRSPNRRSVPLSLVRLWGGRDPDLVELGDEPTILIAGIDQLASWTRHRPNFYTSFPTSRLTCVVIDEAHSLITREHRAVLVALRLRAQHQWRTLQPAPLVVGLSATPWRTKDAEVSSLRRYFSRGLLKPGSLGKRPVSELQRRGILARVRAEQMRVRGTRPMSAAQRRRFEQFKDLPNDYLAQLGLDPARNQKILRQLSRIPKRCRTIVFACSVAHAEILTMALNRALGDDCAALVTGQTPRAERAEVIERFRNGRGLRFLCNVGVLTTGFDAPRADVICMTRPTTSALRYEQMVGRGLRGPKNGGTRECRVLDVQDDGLPEGIQSYARVLHLWDRRRPL